MVNQGIEPRLYQKIKQTLIDCVPFDDPVILRALFNDARLYPWKSQFPTIDNPESYAYAIVDLLYGKRNSEGQNALALFVQVLRDNTHTGDACYAELSALADELSRELGRVPASPEVVLVPPSPTKPMAKPEPVRTAELTAPEEPVIPDSAPPPPPEPVVPPASPWWAWLGPLCIVLIFFLLASWIWCLTCPDPDFIEFTGGIVLTLILAFVAMLGFEIDPLKLVRPFANVYLVGGLVLATVVMALLLKPLPWRRYGSGACCGLIPATTTPTPTATATVTPSSTPSPTLTPTEVVVVEPTETPSPTNTPPFSPLATPDILYDWNSGSDWDCWTMRYDDVTGKPYGLPDTVARGTDFVFEVDFFQAMGGRGQVMYYAQDPGKADTCNLRASAYPQYLTLPDNAIVRADVRILDDVAGIQAEIFLQQDNDARTWYASRDSYNQAADLKPQAYTTLRNDHWVTGNPPEPIEWQRAADFLALGIEFKVQEGFTVPTGPVRCQIRRVWVIIP